MILTIWYLLMVALLWSVFYRSALADRRTKLSVRLSLTCTAIAGLVGVGAPLYGWVPDAVVIVIVLSVVYMQITFAQSWEHHVPGQYIKPEYRILRRKGDFEPSHFREVA